MFGARSIWPKRRFSDRRRPSDSRETAQPASRARMASKTGVPYRISRPRRAMRASIQGADRKAIPAASRPQVKEFKPRTSKSWLTQAMKTKLPMTKRADSGRIHLAITATNKPQPTKIVNSETGTIQTKWPLLRKKPFSDTVTRMTSISNSSRPSTSPNQIASVRTENGLIPLPHAPKVGRAVASAGSATAAIPLYHLAATCVRSGCLGSTPQDGHCGCPDPIDRIPPNDHPHSRNGQS